MKIKTIIFFLALLLFLPGTVLFAASTLDLGWGPPSLIKIEKNKKPVLIWQIQISNGTPRRKVPKLDIVAVTNTGKQYSATSSVKINLPSYGEVPGVYGLRSSIFPLAARSAFAVFEDFDPKATTINFYVGGLIEDPRGEDHVKYIQITYKRISSGWEWLGTNLLE